jgi:UDPglucose 6-dehydrogenase
LSLLDNAREDLKDVPQALSFEVDPYRATDGAHAVALLTDWQLYRDLNYERILQSMEQPAFLFDGRNILITRSCLISGSMCLPSVKRL